MILRITAEQYAEIRHLTRSSFTRSDDFPVETGCILLIGKRSEHAPLLVREVLPAQEADVSQSHAALTFSARYLRRALWRVRERGLGGFLTVHTHPFSIDKVNFSPYDDSNDPALMENLHELQPEATFGSLVLGRKVAKGRVWQPDNRDFCDLSAIVAVGEEIEFVKPSVTFTDGLGPASLFDRSAALTGDGALGALAKMRIAVVGSGGTGSLMAELLARAGAGEVQIFDFDRAEISNLNRVLHLRMSDAESMCMKATRLMEALSELKLPTRVITSQNGGDIRDESTAKELVHCDLIVGCMDRDWPRLIISEIAYQYLIPYLDLGTEITATDTGIQSIDARISLSGPGRPCLLCSGVVSLDRVRIEGYAAEEQRRQIETGYSPDIHLAAPAVMDLNMRSTSMAMLVIRHLLQPFLATPLGHVYRETVTSFHVRCLQFAKRIDCVICSTYRLGVGDEIPLTTRKQSWNDTK